MVDQFGALDKREPKPDFFSDLLVENRQKNSYFQQGSRDGHLLLLSTVVGQRKNGLV
jgi:hypothetical protein